MKNISFTVPYSIGTYLIKNVDGNEHLDQINSYIIDEKGLFVILMLDVQVNPRLSTAISIDDLIQNWKEDTSIHLSSNIGSRLNVDFPHGDGPTLELNKKN